VTPSTSAGEWVAAGDHETIDVIRRHHRGGRLARSRSAPRPTSTPAVAAARAGFEAWSQTTVEQRIDALRAITAGLQERAEEIAALVAREVGMPMGLSRMIQAGLPIMSFGVDGQPARRARARGADREPR